MGDKAEQIERHIDQQRHELRDNVAELRQRARDAMDWRLHVETRPLAMLGLAFGGGVLLSILMGGRQQASRRAAATSPGGFPGRASAGTWNQVKGALLAVAATKLESAMESLVPGFQDEYRKAGVAGRHHV